MSLDGYERKLLYKNERGYLPGGVSPDRRYIALDQGGDQRRVATSTSMTAPPASSPRSPPTRRTASDVANSAQDFSPDGKSLYYTTDQGSQFAYLVRYDLATGKRTEVLRPKWDVQEAGFSRDGRWFTVAINNDAKTELRIFQAAGMKPVKLPGDAGGHHQRQLPAERLADGLLRRVGRARATSTSATSRPARSASSPTRSTRRSIPRTWSRRRWCASSPSTAPRSPACSTSR